MTDKQINEFPTVAPADTDLLVKQSNSGQYQKCSYSQVKSDILAQVPADVDYIDRPGLSNVNLNIGDTFELQRPSDELYYNTTLQNMYLWFANKMYPIGSYYYNYSNSTNPSTLLGFGTWVQVRGRVLVGEGSGTDINGVGQNFPAGSTGGEYLHNLSVSELPTHDHYIYTGGSFGGTAIGSAPTSNVAYDTNFGGTEAWQPRASSDTPDQGKTGDTGADISHNNVQPYETAYMWRRTA